MPASARADDSAMPIDARLDLQLEAKDAQFWHVRLKLIDPQTPAACISELENHSSSDNTTGGLDLSPDARTLTFQTRHATDGGAVRFRVRASRGARLIIQGVNDAANQPRAVGPSAAKEIAIAELLPIDAVHSDSIHRSAAGGVAGRWTLRRVAGDPLRIENLRQVPVYEPGSPLGVAVSANGLTDHASRSLTMEYSLYRVSTGETVASHRRTIQLDAGGNSESISIGEALPEAPGVYEIRLQIAKREETIWSRIRRQELPIVRLSRPIIVVHDGSQPPQAQSNDWTEVGVIRPSESSWSVGQWLPKQTSRLIPGSSRAVTDPLNADLAHGEHAGQSVSLIEPQKTFQATLPVMTPGLPHKVTIRYPRGGVTRLRIDVASAEERDSPAVSFQLASDPFADQVGQWQTHTFLHYPSGDDQVWLTNLDSDKPAEFESISVQAGPTGLPPRAEPHPRQRTTVLKLPDIDWVDSLTHDLSKKTSLASCDHATLALYRLWIASERVRDYASAMNLSSVMVPANSVGTSWYASELFFPRQNAPAKTTFYLPTFMKLMEGSNLGVWVSLQPNMLLAEPERSIRRQPDLARKLTRQRNHRLQYNPLDPAVQRSLASLVGELSRQCDGYACFAGIALHCGPASHLYPPQKLPEEPEALARFAQSNGVTASGAKLQTWVGQQDMTTRRAWLRDQMRHVYERLAESAGGTTVLMIMDRPDRGEVVGGTKDVATQLWAGSWRGERKNLVPATSLRYGSPKVLAEESLLQHKLSTASGPVGGAVLLEHRQTDQAVLVRPRLMADVTRIIDRLDPEMLVVEFPLLGRSLNREFAQMLHHFSVMPTKLHTIEPIDSAAQTVRLRSGSRDGHLYLAMTSLAPWTSDVDLETSTPIDWVVVNNTDQSAPTVRVQQTSDRRTSVTVPAAQLIVLRSKSKISEASIRSWATRVSGGAEALKQIKSKVTSVVERIGILSDMKTYDHGLANGGFERSGGMGLLGWLHSQHPPGCVRVDDKESLEGKHSVRLTTDASTMNRTWIVSETITPPRSGRLAVSLACRAELHEDGSNHRLRVSIEATRNRVPIRHSREVNVPRNGQWGPREVVMEADGIQPGAVDSLRLTIDSLSGGRVWVDDVRLHDQFPTAKERAELESQAFLAVRGLQLGNLTPSGRLLQNHWARHLLALDPPKEPAPVIEAPEPAEETPGVAERIRAWLPSPLRF